MMLAKTFLVISLLAMAGSFALLMLIIRHAFRESPGLGVLVIFLPLFNIFYALTHFEHPRKGWVVGGWLGLMSWAICLTLMAMRLMAET